MIAEKTISILEEVLPHDWPAAPWSDFAKTDFGKTDAGKTDFGKKNNFGKPLLVCSVSTKQIANTRHSAQSALSIERPRRAMGSNANTTSRGRSHIVVYSIERQDAI